jgi:two-component system, sensor histidine kinase ChiS
MLANKHIRYVALIFLTINVLNVFSQKNQYIFNQVTIENGLSNNSITCIFKDSRGFIWIGTIDGLNRYDGYNFEVYKHNPSDLNSISDNFISTIIEDYSGNLWIGTQGGGLNKYDPQIDRFISFYYDSKNINSLPSNFIFHHNSMIIDKDSTIWIGTDNGLCSYNIRKNLFNRFLLKSENYNHDEFKDIRAIYEGRNNILWIGTNTGLVKFSRDQGILKVYVGNKNNQHALSSNIITALAEDVKRNELWIGTEEGLNIFDETKEIFSRYLNKQGKPGTISDNSITSIVMDENNNFWIGTKSGGLNKCGPADKKFVSWTYNSTSSNGISDNYIDNLFFDKKGLLWIGTVNTGINILDVKEKKFGLFRHDPGNPNSLSYNTIRSIYEDREKNIWIGTYGGGLNKYNSKDGFVHYYYQPDNPFSLSHNIISALYEDETGNLWIGTWGGGLNIMPKQRGAIYRNLYSVPDFVQDIYQDKDQNLWFGCNGGLYLYNNNIKRANRFDSETSNHNKLTASSVNKVIRDHLNNLWVGTFNGLNKIIFKKSGNLEIDTIIRFLNDPSDINTLSNNRILSLFEDNQNNLWIGTYAGGLNKLKIHQCQIAQVM